MLYFHVAATVFMCGVIWFVQLVHYPLFAQVGEAGFVQYEAAHTMRTSWVVMPPMLIELGTAAALLVWRPPGLGSAEVALGLGLVLLIWASTFFLQVPAHGALGRGFDPAVASRLVSTNWIRTVLWTLRAGLVIWWMSRVA